MKFILSSTFGEMSEVRNFKPHTGIDLPMEIGTTLRSLMDGEVFKIVDQGAKGLGKGVIIKAEDGNYHIFGHLSKINVEKGQLIEGGDIIGLSGTTGNSTGGHLHFGMQTPNGEFIDPTGYGEALAAITGDVTPLQIVNAVNSVEPGGFWGDILDGWNQLGDAVIGKQIDWIFKPIAEGIEWVVINSWNWFILNLPDIMGYSAILAAICIILGSMFGRSGMMKPLAIYSGALILALCILGSI